VLDEARDAFPQLVEYDSEERSRELLRKMPRDLSEVLSLEPAYVLVTASQIHGLHAHWSTRMAVAKANAMAATAAKEVGFARIRETARKHLNRMYHKVTVDRVDDRARGDPVYAALCLAEAEAVQEYLRIRGLVDAIQTKRESLKQIFYVLNREKGMAEETYTTSALEDYDSRVRSALQESSLAMMEDHFGNVQRGQEEKVHDKKEKQVNKKEGKRGGKKGFRFKASQKRSRPKRTR